MENILASLKARSAWYEKAIKMSSREIEWENGFDWPELLAYHPQNSNNRLYWRGAKKEIDNTINMIEAAMKRSGTE